MASSLLRQVRAAVLFLPLLMASACSDELPNLQASGTDERITLEFSALINQNNSSRADENGFADGDRFGVFVVNYSGDDPGTLTLSENQVNNVAVKYDAESGKWTTATDIYWRDNTTPVDVYGYYPFYNGLSDVEAHRFEILADQSVAPSDGDMGAYEASDLLWAKASRVTPGTRIELTFNHVMAGVKVVLQKGEGFEGDTWEKLPRIVTVDNTTRTAAVDFATGTVTPSGTPDRNIVMSTEGDTYRAVVVPQSVEAGRSVIGITIDGLTYNFERESGMTYTAGKLHTFTLAIDRREADGTYTVSLVSEEITPWETDQSSHSFEANSYFVVNVPVAGTLKDCITAAGADYSTVKNLKVTGQLTEEDFTFIREKMSKLACINLKDAKMVHIEYRDNLTTGVIWEGPDLYVDDILPVSALSNMESIRRVILPDGITLLGMGSLRGLRLTSSLIIPETVSVIEAWALSDIHGEEAYIEMPSTLESIGEGAFSGTSAAFDLKLSNTIKYIGGFAFSDTRGATGTFNVPSKLEYLGEDAFGGCGHDLVGDIIIPAGINEIPRSAFSNIGFKQKPNLTIPEGVKTIKEGAFAGIQYASPLIIPESVEIIEGSAFKSTSFPNGSVKFPNNLKYLGRHAFAGCNISGEFTFPASLDIVLGGEGDWSGTFCGTQLEKITIGDNILQIERNAFDGLPNLKYLHIGKNVESIGSQAFNNAPYLQTVVCLAPTPPQASSDAFVNIYFDKCILEVPESAVEAYRNATGWNQFRNITPHHELAFNISDIACLDKGITREGIIRAEGPWSVSECPEWVHVSPDHADYKANLTITVDPMPAGSEQREGKIVFRLNDKDYTTYTTVRQLAYEYPQDTEIILRAASAGAREVPVFIVGEGFNTDDIARGEYMRRMNETMEQLFAIEPYKSYIDYFTVTTAVACSPDSGTGDVYNVKMNCFDSEGVIPDQGKLKDYVSRVSSHAGSNMSNALIIMVSNYNSFTGWSEIDWDGCTMAGIGIIDDVYPYDQRGLVQHFAGGEAFAGLGNEAVEHFEHIRGCTCPFCNDLGRFNDLKGRGLFANLTMSSKMSDAPWSDFIFHPKYSSMVDMWEGGFRHLRGVWRSEVNSVMNTYIAYYNTISRYAIYREIMRRSGSPASLDDFIANDKIEIPQ